MGQTPYFWYAAAWSTPCMDSFPLNINQLWKLVTALDENILKE